MYRLIQQLIITVKTQNLSSAQTQESSTYTFIQFNILDSYSSSN